MDGTLLIPIMLPPTRQLLQVPLRLRSEPTLTLGKHRVWKPRRSLRLYEAVMSTRICGANLAVERNRAVRCRISRFSSLWIRLNQKLQSQSDIRGYRHDESPSHRHHIKYRTLTNAVSPATGLGTLTHDKDSYVERVAAQAPDYANNNRICRDR